MTTNMETTAIRIDLFKLVYQEKHLNFRHFDNLRWQVPALVVALAGGMLSFAGDGLIQVGKVIWGSGDLQIDDRIRAQVYSLLLILFGLFALAAVWLMHRLAVHLIRNQILLKEAFDSLVSLPQYRSLIGIRAGQGMDKTSLWQSANVYFMLLVWIAGVTALVGGCLVWCAYTIPFVLIPGIWVLWLAFRQDHFNANQVKQS